MYIYVYTYIYIYIYMYVHIHYILRLSRDARAAGKVNIWDTQRLRPDKWLIYHPYQDFDDNNNNYYYI